MKILDPNFKLPENPCNGCELKNYPICNDCIQLWKYQGQQSILSQLKEVDLNQLAQEWMWRNYDCVNCGFSEHSIPFEEFITERI